MSERVLVGRVGRPHGLDGSFVVEDASEDRSLFARGAKHLVKWDGSKITILEEAFEHWISKKGNRSCVNSTA